MNYQPVTAGNQPNPSVGIQEHFDADKAGEGNVQQYVLFPLWSFGFKDPQNTDADATFEVKKPESEVHVSPSRVRNLCDDFEEFSDNSINEVNAASTPVTAVGQNLTNSTNTFSAVGPSNTAVSPTLRKYSYVDPSQYPDDPDMPTLEDITYSDDEEDVGIAADLSNLETNINVSPIPTTRVDKDHPGKGFSGVESPLFKGMIVEQQVDEGADEVHDEGVPTAVGVAAEGDVSAVDDVVPTTVEKLSIPSPTP
nr:hypothetical protein [Tanacetum cinerariifolium]